MERFRGLAVAIVLVVGSIAVAGVRDRQWQRVHEAMRNGLPRSAFRALDPIVRTSLQRGDYPQATRAIVQRIALEGAIQGNKPEEKVRRLEKEIASAPRGMRPVLEAILAHWYWEYFEANRWRIIQRSRTEVKPGDDFTTWDLPRLYAEIDAHFARALAARQVLRRVPIGAYDALIDRGSAPDAYRPTLYDFIAFDALGFYTSGEQAAARPEDAFELRADGPIFDAAGAFTRWQVAATDSTSPALQAVRLYQELLHFHAADVDPSARLDADLARLRFGMNVAVGAEKDARYKAALQRLAARNPNHELSARALAQWATVVHGEGDEVAAWRIAQRGTERFPESPGGHECYNLIQQIEAKVLSITTERVWSSPPPTLDVHYRNLTRVCFRLVPYDFLGWHLSQEAELDSILAMAPIRMWSDSLPPTPDYRERVRRLDVPRGIPPGSYFLLATDTPSFSTFAHPIYLNRIWVSELAMIVRHEGDGETGGFVLEAASGAPVPGADVLVWTGGWGRSSPPDTTLVTDRNGRFRLVAKDWGCVLLARRGDQRLASLGSFYRWNQGRPDRDQRTLFFTDRALYRPGQVIRYKGICIDLDPARDRYTTITRQVLTVVFRDGNGKEIARAEQRTNDYGSFSGAFTAPGDRLLGGMTLYTEAGPWGSTQIGVEEYKRPTFVVSLEPPKTAATLRGTVSLAGTATSYTGAPIDGAQVRWRVVRQVRYPDWWYWYCAGYRGGQTASQEIGHGVSTTGADGSFVLAFTATPDAAVRAEDEPVFSYAVHADVTEPAGETRSADRIVSVGYTALRAGLSANDWETENRPVEWMVRTTTLDGVTSAVTGELTIHRLRQPARVARASLDDAPWPRRLGEVIDAGEAEGSDPAQWPDDRAIARRRVTTDSAGVARLRVSLVAGVYRARFETRDRFGHHVSAMRLVRVLAPDSPRCPIRVPDLLAAPTWSVEPGEEFLAVWGSGYGDARAYIEVEHRGRLLQAHWTTPGRNQVAIRQRVSEAMRGGFMVRVTMVHENRAYVHDVRVDVPWTNKRLAIRWEHFVSRLQPGQHERWTAVIAGSDATRAVAEMVATLYDASLDVYRAPGWPSGFGVFRQENQPRESRFENTDLELNHVGWWRVDSRDPTISYRSFPAEVLWNWRYDGGRLWGRHETAEAPRYRRAPGGRTGRITGRVLGKDKRGVAFANAVVIDTRQGAMTDENGGFVIDGVPALRQQVRVQALGYDPIVQTVRVRAGRTVAATFVLGSHVATKSLEEIAVRADRRIDTRSSSAKQSITAEKLRELPVDNLADAVALKAGVIVRNGELHFRGGRSGEVTFQFDGAEASEPSVSDAVLARVQARRNLQETAFFFPHLVSNARGEVTMEFTMPEALTEWRFLGFAHDRWLRGGLLEGRAVTSLDVMVQPNPPRFLREGDVVETTVKVTNRSETRQSGRVSLRLSDAVSGGSADSALDNRTPAHDFDIPPRESRTFAWRLSIPDGMGALTYRAVASTGRQSDGEEGYLPVLSRRVLVTESLPLPIRGPATRVFDFSRLRLAGASTTLRHQSLTVQMVSHPAWYAIMALPYLMEFPHECTEQTFNRLYANALARHIAASDPKLRSVFDQWRGTRALDSPLEKNPELKAVTLEETPWLRQAEAESQARRNVGILFDTKRLDAETASLERRLADAQLPDGAWAWFPGGRADDFITLYITTGYGRLRHLGVPVDSTPAIRSLDRLDGWVDDIYRRILERGSRERNNLSPTIALYLYGRSFFLHDRAVGADARAAVDYWLDQARRYWLELPNRQSQGQLALALARFGDGATARAIMRSLRERAVHDDELGMFWRDEELSWWWYRAPIETQAVLIEAFQEVLHDSAAVEDCKVWLLKQKQTQDWKTTKATADAVYALLLRGDDLLAADPPVEVSLGDRLVRPDTVEAGTGYYEQRFGGGEISPALARITVKKTDRGVAWGSVHWQFLEDMSALTPYTGTPLTLHKALFVRRNGRAGPALEPVTGPIHVGDELVVRVELRVDRDMEYVHLKDYRGSGVEPVDVLSGYRYRDGLAYYQETRDVASHFFIDYLPKGTYVFEYSTRIQLRGRYQTGMAQIQCMYAPEFGSHSESLVLDVQ